MTCRPVLVGILALCAGVAFPEESLESRVNRALDRAAANLIGRQEEDGSWRKDDKVHPLGRTALCTYALLHAGIAPDHEAVRKGLRFLRLDDPSYFTEITPHSTYEAGCLLLLMHALGPPYDGQIRRVCEWLVGHFDQGPKLWGYPDGQRDLSNTQFAVLGLKVGEMHGYEVPDAVWKGLLRGVPRLQARDGAFRYRAGSLYRATMTHAALIVLQFACEGLGLRRPPREVERAMERGHAWCAAHYDMEHAPFGRGHHTGHYYYYLYGLERYAQIFGLETIAGRDWYADGAEALLGRQEENGSWGNHEDTCFAILFLRKVVFTSPRAREGAGADQAGGGRKAGRPRPREGVPFLRDWLVAGPFPSTRWEDDMLYEEHFPLRRCIPAPGRRAGKRKWEVYSSPEDRVDLERALGEGDWSIFYAALWLHAEADVDALLWICTDDGFKLYLDGEEILEGHHHDFPGDDWYRVPLPLKAGPNLLLVKSENCEYYAVLKARLSDAEGGPLAGVTASLRRKR